MKFYRFVHVKNCKYPNSSTVLFINNRVGSSYLTISAQRMRTEVEFGLVMISTVCGGDSHFKDICDGKCELS